MNIALRRFGLRNQAPLHMTLLFMGGIVALVGSAVYSSIRLWPVLNMELFQTLNGCVEQDGSLAWFYEQSYQPSPEYASCVASVHHAATIEVSLAVGLLACAILALIVWLAEDYTDDYITTSSGLPIYTTRFRAVRTGIGIAALLLVAMAVGILYPAG